MALGVRVKAFKSRALKSRRSSSSRRHVLDVSHDNNDARGRITESSNSRAHCSRYRVQRRSRRRRRESDGDAGRRSRRRVTSTRRAGRAPVSVSRALPDVTVALFLVTTKRRTRKTNQKKKTFAFPHRSCHHRHRSRNANFVSLPVRERRVREPFRDWITRTRLSYKTHFQIDTDLAKDLAKDSSAQRLNNSKYWTT